MCVKTLLAIVHDIINCKKMEKYFSMLQNLYLWNRSHFQNMLLVSDMTQMSVFVFLLLKIKFILYFMF